MADALDLWLDGRFAGKPFAVDLVHRAHGEDLSLSALPRFRAQAAVDRWAMSRVWEPGHWRGDRWVTGHYRGRAAR